MEGHQLCSLFDIDLSLEDMFHYIIIWTGLVKVTSYNKNYPLGYILRKVKPELIGPSHQKTDISQNVVLCSPY